MSEKIKYQIHATNIYGLGAINVAEKIINGLIKKDNEQIEKVFLSESLNIVKFKHKKKFARNLPNTISRLIEIYFAKIYFKNINTLILGDIPLYGISKQIVFVHQPNLISPRVNEFSSRSLKFKLLRKIFYFNLKFVSKIIVQTDYMKEDLISSYGNKLPEIFVKKLPPISDYKNQILFNKKIDDLKLKFFYPSSFYKHKNHDFLFELNKLKDKKFEIYLTLDQKDFERFQNLSYVKNLGILSHENTLKFLSKSDGLLFLSNLESFGLPLVEAMQLKKPIIAIKRNYSKWMCEGYAYYFSDKKTFELSINQLRKDYADGRLLKSNMALKKFDKNWDEIIEDISKIIEN
jgi:hypothetical protein